MGLSVKFNYAHRLYNNYTGNTAIRYIVTHITYHMSLRAPNERYKSHATHPHIIRFPLLRLRLGFTATTFISLLAAERF